MVAASAFFFPHLARVRARVTFGHGIDEHDENGTLELHNLMSSQHVEQLLFSWTSYDCPIPLLNPI